MMAVEGVDRQTEDQEESEGECGLVRRPSGRRGAGKSSAGAERAADPTHSSHTSAVISYIGM